MLLCLGQEKALCTPPIPVEPWTGERIQPANPRDGDCRLIPNNKMQNCSCHQQFPMLDSQEGFQTNGQLQTKLPAVPCMESGDGLEDWGFPLKNLGLSFEQNYLPAQLGSRKNHLPAQTDVSCKGKPVRLGAQSKESRAQNQEGTYP